eukprot:1160581-Pelagomonas_calceolata.AAC.15
MGENPRSSELDPFKRSCMCLLRLTRMSRLDGAAYVCRGNLGTRVQVDDMHGYTGLHVPAKMDEQDGAC